MKTCNFNIVVEKDNKLAPAAGRMYVPSISITHDSVFLSKKLMELMGNPKYITIGFDEKNKIIAFKKSDISEENDGAYYIRNVGNHGGRRINRQGLVNRIQKIRYFNPNTETLFLDDVMINSDGFLCFCFYDAKVKTRYFRKNK